MSYSTSSFQLTHLMQKAYRRVANVRTSTATGGSTTTIVDAKLLDYLEDSNEDDYLNNWTVFVVTDSAGAGADPEGKFSIISDYTAETGTITVPSSLTTAVASGDTYMYCTPEVPIYDMIEIVNDALVYLGKTPRVDSTLTTANNQTEYTLPLAIKGRKIVMIEVQGQINDANDNRYYLIHDWKVVESAIGSTATLIIPQYVSGRTIRITYLDYHPRVDAYDDYISEYIHPELATASVVAHATRWINTQNKGNDKYLLQREDKAFNDLDIAKATYPISLPAEQVQPFHWNTWIEDEFYPIPLP